MNFKELCEKRYSCRLYKSDAIEKEKMDYVLECARLAPSAVNKQPWRLRLLEEKGELEKACSCYGREWIASAPAILIVSVMRSEAWVRSYDSKYHGDIDAAIITEHICLAAAEQGLGTCWVCNFDAAKCHELLGLGEDEEAVVMIPIGYAADSRPEKKRKAEICI